MKETVAKQYIKRTQKDYSYALKLAVVQEVENGELGIKAAARKYGIQSHSTVTTWLRKYGNFDWINKSTQKMPKSKDQQLLELEQKILLLEKQKKELEKKVEQADKKAIFFDMMIDIAEEDGAARAVQNSYQKKVLTQAINRYKTEQNESLTSLCRLLGINRQIYYRSIHINKHTRKLIDKVLVMVRDIRLQMPRIGTRKLFYLLLDKLKPLNVGRDRLFSILKANNLLIKPKRSYHITTDSHHRFKKHKNLIENVTPSRPEQIWVSDITYIGNRTNPMYLSLVTDAYSKKIVGYHVANTLETKASVEALKMAIKNRSYRIASLTHHSDRGFQYCSADYQKVLTKNSITCSMTESYDPYANAIAERVNGILKQEFIGYDRNIDIKMMSELVENSIRIYNQIRPHYSCDYKTPQVMHQQCQLKIRTYKKRNPIVYIQVDSLN